MNEHNDIRNHCNRHARNGGECRYQWVCDMVHAPIESKRGNKRENSIGTIMGRIKDVVRVAIMATVGRLNSG